jgi:peptidyl-prolyl cis-trans isomerase SurA
MTRLLSAGLAALCVAAPLDAQQQESGFRTLDRIVAVVGTHPITYTNVVEEINMLRQAGAIGEIPTDPAALAALERQVLDQLIDEELLVQQAERDTLVSVTDERVQSSVEQALRQVRGQFASELEYRRELQQAGFGTPEDYRRFFTERRRRELMQQTLIQSLQQRGVIRPVPPTREEMRTYFEAGRERFPSRPASVSFRQIVVRPDPAPSAVTDARALADSLHRELSAGADFATVARRFSDDPGTAQQGGQLGWFRRGSMVPEFERWAFNLRPGVLSPVFRTPFGFHILQIQRIEPSEVQGRHVLITPEVTDADRESARARADSIAVTLRQGVPFDSLLRLHHHELDQSLFDEVSQADLAPSLQGAIAEAEPGDVLGPVEVTEGGPVRYAVIRFLDRKPEGAYTFEELQDMIRRNLSEESGIRRYLADLRDQIYVDIRL